MRIREILLAEKQFSLWFFIQFVVLKLTSLNERSNIESLASQVSERQTIKHT